MWCFFSEYFIIPELKTSNKCLTIDREERGGAGRFGGGGCRGDSGGGGVQESRSDQGEVLGRGVWFWSTRDWRADRWMSREMEGRERGETDRTS